MNVKDREKHNKYYKSMLKYNFFVLPSILAEILEIIQMNKIEQIGSETFVSLLIFLMMANAPIVLIYYFRIAWIKALISFVSLSVAIGIYLEVHYGVYGDGPDIALGLFEIFGIFCMILLFLLTILFGVKLLISKA